MDCAWFIFQVKATRWDDKPASGERVRICRYPSFGEQAAETNKPTCNSGDTDMSGVARVMFAAEDDGSPFYRFEVSRVPIALYAIWEMFQDIKPKIL